MDIDIDTDIDIDIEKCMDYKVVVEGCSEFRIHTPSQPFST